MPDEKEEEGMGRGVRGGGEGGGGGGEENWLKLKQ